ncbi:MAG: carboxypeptidase regulatory-like domain-containing protein [Muribaculaceae bacterium]|nr:carboxypeptidase regulatory-like domain-containing protein [Muribaculaceae bacterium]
MLGLKANAAMWLVGDAFNGWNESGNVEMTESNGIYTYTADLTAGKYFAFFKDSQSWDYQRGPMTGDAAPTGDWEATKSGGAWKVATSGTYEIQYNYSTDQAKIAIQTSTPFDATQRKFAVTGAAFGGWNMPPADNQVFTNNGDGTYTLEFEGATAGEFKLSGVGINDVFDAGWGVFNGGAMGKSGLAEGDNTLSTSFGSGNMSFPVSGNVVLTISNVTESSCNLNITLQQEIIPDVDYYLVGETAGWSNNDAYKFAKNEAGDTYTLTTVFSGEFKIHTSTDVWYGNGSEITAENNTVDLNTNGNNMTIAAQDEPYTLTITKGEQYDVLTVTGFATPQPVEPYATIYIDKTSVEGNIYAWDNDGENYGAWPGSAITSLETGEKDGVEYYVFNFTHENAIEPKVIFNSNGDQTADISVADGDVLKYLGGNSYVLNGVTYPPVPQITGVHLFGAVGDAEWTNLGELTENEGVYTLADKDVEAGLAFKVVVSYDIAEDAWYGAQTDGAEFLVNANMLDVDITMGIDTEETNFENLYFEKAGQFTFAFTMGEEAATLKITGEFIPETKVLTGTVRGEDNQPIAGVTVTAVAITDEPQGIIRAEGQPLTTVTNDEGTFELKVPADANYNVTFAKDGYVTQTVGEDAIENVVLVESTPTGIASLLANGNVASVSYVNVSGSVSDKPFDGMNIVVVTYNDGSRQVAKVVK